MSEINNIYRKLQPETVELILRIVCFEKKFNYFIRNHVITVNN